MMGVPETALDDGFNPEAKKVTAVYKRRAKEAETQVRDSSTSGLRMSGSGKIDSVFAFRDEGAKNRVVPGKNGSRGKKDSWFNRSLSFRGRRSSLVPTHRQPLASLTNNILGSPSNGILKKKSVQTVMNTRRTWTGVPSSYVKEQRAIFADVDAFDLDEKEVIFSPFAKKQLLQQQMRDSLDFAKSQMLKYGFAFGEALRNPTLSDSELLSAALQTPHRALPEAEPKKFHIPAPPLITEERVSLNNPFWLSGINNDQDVPSPETLRDKPATRRSSRHSAETARQRDIPSRLSTSSWISNDEENDLARPSPDVYAWDQPMRRRSSRHSAETARQRDIASRLSASSWISNDEENDLARPSPDVYAWDQPMRRRSSRSSADSASQGRNSRSVGIIDEGIPTPVSIHTREDSAILDFETASLLNRMETLHIQEGDNHNIFRKMGVCTPVSEEGEEEAEEEIHGVFRKISHCTPVPEGSEEECEVELDRPDAHDSSLEREVALSVFDVLLQECRQTEILTLSEALSDFCDLREIKKLGEGTYGEAFRGGGNVFKIVPMDGSFQVNGETQKTSGEMLSEVVLSNALNKLRGGPKRDESNICNSFVETKATRICQGCYDPELVRSWEDWDALNTSENDHPSIFPNHQLYVVFVLTDGGRDLESFALENFNEARSLLLQIVLALAVAEEACEFEHRDLHWGNIVLARDQHEHVPFRFLGQEKRVKTHGLSVSLIDFTLSRLNTGNQVLFCNLAADPALFEGPKNDVQANTYRRMLKITEGQWEGRFLKTNCLWIHYVADILLCKKTFKSSSAEKRSLRDFRKRVLLYESAGAAVLDDFFNGMWADL